MSEVNSTIGSKLWVIHMYQEQLDKFAKIGLGNKTENGVVVTERLIANTQKRLDQLTVIYDSKLSYNALKLRMLKLKAKEKLLNGQTNSNGTTTSSRMQDKRTIRHKGGK